MENLIGKFITKRMFKNEKVYKIIDFSNEKDVSLQNSTKEYLEEIFGEAANCCNEKNLNLDICNNFQNYIFDFKKLILKSDEIYKLQYSFEDVEFNIFANDEIFEIMINISNQCELKCDNCNFKCKANRLVDLDTILKGINHIEQKITSYNKSNAYKKHIITFYGADPLNESAKIIKIIDFLKKNYTFDIVFNVITNGILLNDNIVNFLVDYDINTYVYLDFKIERYIIEPNKSYRKILRNLLVYKKKYPFNKNINIITNYDFYTDLEKSEKLSEDNKLPPIVLLKEKASGCSGNFDKMKQAEIDEYLEQYKRLSIKYDEHNDQGKECSSYLRCLFS